jgi:U6 snRNA-associated Sm-like protein LSm1
MPLPRAVVRRNRYLSCHRKCSLLPRSSWTSQTVRLRHGNSSFLFPVPHADETDWIVNQETGGSFADDCKTAEKLMVALRDGRKLIGVLRSWDQFANLVLQSTIERIFAPSPDSAGSDRPTGLYADINHGIFLVRGENVLLLGEIDLDLDDDPPPGFELADLEVVKKIAEEKKAADKARDKVRVKKLAKHGFEGENIGEIVL